MRFQNARKPAQASTQSNPPAKSTPAPPSHQPQSLRALQQTHGNQYVMRLMRQTQGPVVQREINGKTTLSDIEEAIKTNLTAYYIYSKNGSLRDTIDENLKDVNNYKFYKNASNPLELSTTKSKGYSELSGNDAIANGYSTYILTSHGLKMILVTGRIILLNFLKRQNQLRIG